MEAKDGAGARPAEDDLDCPIWGARAIGKVIGKGARATHYLLEAGRLDATKIGRQWVSTPRRLRAGLVGSGADLATRDSERGAA